LSEERTIECIDDAPCADSASKNLEYFLLSGGSQNLWLRGERDGHEWEVFAPEIEGTFSELLGATCKEVDDTLQWSDGIVWTRNWQDRDEQPLLASLGFNSVRNLRQAATNITNITSTDRGDAAPCERRWLPRLVPFRTTKLGTNNRCYFLSPLDIGKVETMISDFAQKLSDKDVQSDDDQGDDFSDEDEASGRNQDANADDDDDNEQVDTSQEGIDDEYLLLLAEEGDWSPARSRELLFVETSLALPRTAICVECEQENKQFSKSQLAKHPDERRCKDCVFRSTCAAYKSAHPFGAGPKPIKASDLRTTSLPEQLKPTVAAAAGFASCSICSLRLTAATCSASQRQKPPSKRKCNRCLGMLQT